MSENKRRLVRGRYSRVDVMIGQPIRALRQAKGLSQAQLGAAVGVSSQQIQKYETGINALGPTQLVRAAACLGTSAGRLFDGMDGAWDDSQDDGNDQGRENDQGRGTDQDDGAGSFAGSPLDLRGSVLRTAWCLDAVADDAVRKRLLALVEALAEALAASLAQAQPQTGAEARIVPKASRKRENPSPLAAPSTKHFTGARLG